MEKRIAKSGITDLVSDSTRYGTDKGEISLLTPCKATMQSYEIYCIEGDLFGDIEIHLKKRKKELMNS